VKGGRIYSREGKECLKEGLTPEPSQIGCPHFDLFAKNKGYMCGD